jgi:hypothetical protein
MMKGVKNAAKKIATMKKWIKKETRDRKAGRSRFRFPMG